MNSFKLASGLAMNHSKTCLINTGILLDQENICPELKDLKWPNSFGLLGIDFQKDFFKSDNNYHSPLKAINTEMTGWEYRLPTALGRVGIIKTCLLSKLTHMPICLPSPPEPFFAALDKKFHHFVWGVQSYKIKKDRMYAPYEEGGLRMIPIRDFWASLKLSWFGRAEGSQDLWVDIYKAILREDAGILSTSEVLNLGDAKILELAADLKSHPFWSEALTCLSKVKVGYHISHYDRLMSLPVTDTTLLSKRLDPQGYSTFSDNDIGFRDGKKVTVRDLIFPGTNIFKTKEMLESEGIYINTFLHENFILDRLEFAVKEILEKYDLGTWKDKRNTFASFVIRKCGTAPFRKLMGLHNKFSLMSDGICQRWEKRLEVKMSPEIWRKAFKSIHKGWCDPDHRYFQFKFLNLIVGVGEKLQFTKHNINPACTFCSLTNDVPPIETHEHLFFHCTTTEKLLDLLFEWKPIKILHGERWNIFEFLIWKKGSSRNHELVVNSVFIWVKYFIFSNRYNGTTPNFVALKKYISTNARDMHNILLYKGKSSDFSLIWLPEEYETLAVGYRPLTAAALSSLPILAEIPQFNTDFARESTEPE